ncbi:taurine dioxygenase [Paraburkholderia sacchari]|uniref:TauD/TfdA dioxygenase family protein n=1 Tax=Paraburkholderia sacchari TaxID=159450 RepID=UPI001BCD8AF6|nr:TauD/TfdA family dioxygenase [Paraburkholderia sacchari]
MKIKPLTCSIGAELRDVSIADVAKDDALFAEIKALLLKHRVLFFRDQDITRADHVAFASRFGDLEDHPVANTVPGYPGLIEIYKSEKRDHFENTYHSDASWRANPPKGAVLRCISCPEVGGDTIWVNMVEAYKNLPDDIKAKIEGLRAKHGIEHSFGAVMTTEEREELVRKYPLVDHPVVRTHPETGEKILYVGPFSTHFINYHTPENVRFGQDKTPGASLLLNYLISQAAIPEYQVRFKWEPGSVAIWDNIATQHYAVSDYWPAPRRMERATIMGDRPF